MRDVRKEKQKIADEMKNSINYGKYLQTKEKEQEVTFTILKKKYSKI